MARPETVVSTLLTTLFVTVVVLTNVPSANTQEGCDSGCRLPTFQEFLIFAPKIVRPDMIYEVHVTVNRKYYSNIVVTALLSSDGNEYVTGEVPFSDVGTKVIQLKVPITVRNGTHKLIVEGLVKNQARSMVTANASDVTDYASYLPIYHNESYVYFDPKYVSVFVVMDYPTYVVPSSVLFRIIGVTQDLTPAYTGSMTVYVRDAKGNFVRRWIQRQLNFGLYSSGFDIEYPVNVGDWAIVVDAFGYRYEHPFEVRFWWQRSFEMNVTVPPFMYDSEWGIMGIINGEHPSGEFSYGDTSVTVKMMNQDGTFLPGELSMNLGYVPMLKSFTFSMAEIRDLWGDPAGKDLYFLGTMTDYYYLETLTGTAVTHIIKDGIQLKVLGPLVRTFKPGVPFNIQVALMRSDGTMYKGFYNRQLVVTVSSEPGSPSSSIPEDKQIIPDDNVLNYEVLPGMTDLIIRISVQHPASGNTVELVCYRYYSEKDRFLALTTSTEDPRTESYMTFTVRANFFVGDMNYLIASGGRILLGSRLVMKGKQKTFAVALSRQMAPSAHIVAYCIVEGEVVTDAMSFYVRDTRLLQPTISINYGKDFRQDYIELVANGPPGGYVFTMAADYEMLWRGALLHTFLTEQRVLHEMMSYDLKAHGPYQHTWWINDVSGQWEKTVFFPAATTGMDTNTTIDAVGLIVLSDANITINQEFTPCNRSLGVGICPLSYQCYDLWKTCDGTVDCADGYDEVTCPMPENQKYRMRSSELYNLFWNSRYTDPWQMFWREHYIKQVGQGEIRVLQDESMDPLVLGAFFMHPDQGLSIAKEWVQHDTTRSFFMTVEAPDTIRRGEQIGLRLDIFNNWDQDMEVLIMLVGDPKSYRFIHVEDFGYVVSYAPRTSSGDFQTMLPLKAGVGTYIMMPIVSTLDRGQFTVKLRAFSSQREDYEEFPITVDYDGVVGRYKFTPYLVDLVNTGSLIIPDLKINISERFFDPGARDLLYIPYSGVSTLHVYGDLVSPGMFEDHLTSLNTAWAYHDSGEGYVYEFAVNLQTLNYLQTINLLDDDKLQITLEYMQTIMMRMYAYMQDDGSYKMFRRATRPCVRLTSLALKSLSAALVSQWMEILYIPVKILNKMALWLTEQQNEYGAFVETAEHYYDRSFWPNTTTPSGENETWHIPITSHVLISLSLARRLTGDAKQRADAAAGRAADYLATKIMYVTDPFQMAILTYALQVSHHKQSNTAYNRLRPMGLEHRSTQYLYWAAEDIPDNPIERINNVEFLYERQFHPNVGSAVSATSYALLCYLAHNDMENSVPIMKFITSQRNHLMGWSSTSDTLLALESLTEFSYRQTNRAFYNLQLRFECTSNTTWSHTVQLDRTNFANLYSFGIMPTFGEVKTRATGTGYAQLGLDHYVHYEKPYQVQSVGPPYPSFDLEIDQQRFWGRNYSHLEMTICFRWTRPDISPESGMANVIVGIPTGYIISRDTVEWMYRSNFTGLQRVRFYHQKLITFFSYVGQTRTCFSFIADRWYPVANTSIDHLIKIQEYAETGLQNLSAYNAFTLFQLHICQVCGSFQCPYCDYYNAAPPGVMTSRGWMLCLLCSVLVTWLANTVVLTMPTRVRLWSDAGRRPLH